MSTVISLYSSSIFCEPISIFISNSQSIFFLTSLQWTRLFLHRNKQKHLWLYLLGLSHLDSVSNHHGETEVSRVRSFIHHDIINQPSKAKYFLKSEPEHSPESQHTKEHVGGNTLLAAIVPNQVGCCFLKQMASTFLAFEKVIVLIQVQKGSALQAGSQRHEV